MNLSNLSNTKLWVVLTSSLIIGGLIVGSLAQTPKVFALSDQATWTQPVSAAAGSNVDNSNQTVANSDNSNSTASSSTPSTTTSQTTDPPTNNYQTSTSNTPSIAAPVSSTPQTSGNGTGQPHSHNKGQQNTQNGSAATVTNNINSDSQSGDATVAHSQTGGDATTGAASANALLINEVQTTSEPTASPWQTNTDNVNGNYNGDIDLPSVGTDQTAAQNDGQNSGENVSSNQTDSTINNYLTLLADSGNAKVDKNARGGSATSGNATANAALLNLIDSSVTDEQSFVDVVNILGNLDGNIVIPSTLVSSLSEQPAVTSSNDSTGSNSNNFIINNQVTLASQSGQALVSNNGSSGNATSGNATTDLQLYNLIDSELEGDNALLVLVNVDGTWTGSLLGSPVGTTSALLGNDLQETGDTPANSSNTTTETINNDLSLSAISGNATVANNRSGGNATSGNAQTNADIVNILGDQINLSGWLGVLIINVLGNWNGSLVTPPVLTSSNLTTSAVASISTTSPISGIVNNNDRRIVAIVYDGAPSINVSSPTQINTAVAVLSSSNIKHPLLTLSKINQPLHRSTLNVLTPLLFALAVGLVVTDQVITFRHRKSE
jgi:hypothetical protein